jgi:drug/metabolite transporter (DMT)-like permease
VKAAHHGRESNPLAGIALKIASVTVFMGMSAFIKAAGQLPAGQIVFFRSFFAILPVLLYLAYRRELAAAVYTKRPLGHLLRGLVGVSSMGFGFFALTRLPLPEAVTINYAQPLLVIVFSALFLGERVRAYRWSAVAAGLVGVAIVSWPKLSLFRSGAAISDDELAGVAAALVAATLAALVMLQIRSLVRTEKSAVIVIWFSLTASAVGLLTFPFGWEPLSAVQWILLVSCGFCGGIAQIFMTEAYRHAEASTVAPFEYTSIVLAIAVGYFVFGEQPTVHIAIGGTILICAGIFIVWRERRLGIETAKAREVSPPQ